jgi:hypothetical protein
VQKTPSGTSCEQWSHRTAYLLDPDFGQELSQRYCWAVRIGFGTGFLVLV